MRAILVRAGAGAKDDPLAARRRFGQTGSSGNSREAAMAEERKPGDPPLSEMERLRLQTLADKRNQALDTASDAQRKQDEARRAIIDKMR